MQQQLTEDGLAIVLMDFIGGVTISLMKTAILLAVAVWPTQWVLLKLEHTIVGRRNHQVCMNVIADILDLHRVNPAITMSPLWAFENM